MHKKHYNCNSITVSNMFSHTCLQTGHQANENSKTVDARFHMHAVRSEKNVRVMFPPHPLKKIDAEAAFGLSSKMIICDVVVIKTIFKPEHQKSFRAIPERVCEVFSKKINAEKLTFYRFDCNQVSNLGSNYVCDL